MVSTGLTLVSALLGAVSRIKQLLRTVTLMQNQVTLLPSVSLRVPWVAVSGLYRCRRNVLSIDARNVSIVVAGPMLDATKRHKLFLKMMAPFMCSTYVALVFVGKEILLAHHHIFAICKPRVTRCSLLYSQQRFFCSHIIR